MQVLLLNPPHQAIGSRLAGEHLPPLGLLYVGGALLDAGHHVSLLDAELKPLSLQEMLTSITRAMAKNLDVLMLGHSGSSSVHTSVLLLCSAVKKLHPGLCVVYGGVYPTYHWQDILIEHSPIDIVVRGEGEQTSVALLDALSEGRSLHTVRGIAFYGKQGAVATAPAFACEDLERLRVGWELIAHEKYTYWGGRRAVVVQFSRGCLHGCSYCGQHGFWNSWRSHDPVFFAQEIARLHREYGIQVFNFADELPTASRTRWKKFLEALIEENINVQLVASTRADDIVRDVDILHLYKKAGIIRFLLGIESYDPRILQKIQKGSTVKTDMLAIRLLQKYGILAMATCVVGFYEETDRDFWNSLRSFLRYDPDQIQLIYATPHRWTPFYKTVETRSVIQTDTRLWDYKHQVLATPGMPPWRVFFWFKLTEVLLQARPKVLWRTLFHRDPEYRYGMRWYTKIGRRVWFHEIFAFFCTTRRLRRGPLLRDFCGPFFADIAPFLVRAPKKHVATVETFDSKKHQSS